MNELEAQQAIARDYHRLYGKRFRHFKGNVYVLDAVGVHSETAGMMVVYHSESDPSKTWIRPADMFFSAVDKEKYPDVEQHWRFEQITEDVPAHRSGPKTMADRIRNMTNEELEELFCGFQRQNGCPPVSNEWCMSFAGNNACRRCIAAWLEQEVEL